jgi:hypothetical protein
MLGKGYDGGSEEYAADTVQYERYSTGEIGLT